MNYDRRFYPATDQHLPSADDSSYARCNTREDEGLRGRYRFDGIARPQQVPTGGFLPHQTVPRRSEPYDAVGYVRWDGEVCDRDEVYEEYRPYDSSDCQRGHGGYYGNNGTSHSDLSNDLARYHTTPAHASNDSPWSHIATVTNGGTSSSAQQYTTDVSIDPFDLASPVHHNAEDRSGNALYRFSDASDLELQEVPQDEPLWGETSETMASPVYGSETWDDPLLPNTHQDTHWAGSNEHAAQTQTQDHPELQYMGMPFDQSYPESMNTSRVVVTPSSAQQLDNNKGSELYNLMNYLAGHTSSTDQTPHTASIDCGITMKTPDRTVSQFEGSRDGIESVRFQAIESDVDLAKSDNSSGEEDAILTCPWCPAKFKGIYRRGNYGRHRRSKHSGSVHILACESSNCDKTFQRRDARAKHYQRHHPELLTERKAKNDRDPSRYHINTSDEIRGEDHALFPFKALPQRTSENLQTPLYNDTTPSMPPMVTKRASTEVSHKDEASIRCDICQKEFNRAAELRRHKDSVHNLNLQQYFCKVPGCDRASRPFPRKDKLADHTARVHGQSTTSEAFEHGEKVSEATHRCDYEGCEREFDQRADLLRHQRTHTDKSERPHQCAQCEKSFLYPKDLKRHQATHLDNEDDDKPSFHCEVASCEYGPGKQGFSRKDGMIRHMRRFHPEVIVEKEEV
jgi:hypothetical protein